MITFKNLQLNQEAIQTLNNLIELDINAKAAFRLMRIIKDISSLVEDKLKAEKKILTKWAEKDENGELMPVFDDNDKLVDGAIKIKNIPEFEKEVNELLNMDNSIQHEKINFDDLGLTDMIKIKNLINIDFIFE